MRYHRAMPAKPRRVLFVCWGNICRSPTAEGVLRHLVDQRGVSDAIEVDSAGTIDFHGGEPPDPRMSQAAARRGYTLSGASRLIEPRDLEEFDLVLAMDRKNLADIEEVCGQRTENVRLLSDFLPAGPVEVPDPYFGGAEGFDTVLDLLEEACPRILDRLLGDAGHGD